MTKQRLVTFILIVSALFLGLQGCAGPSRLADNAPEQTLYLKNNIHAQLNEREGTYQASYANWTDPGRGHVIMPVNTQITVTQYRRDLSITSKKTGKTTLLEFDERNMGMNLDQYLKLITSTAPVSLESLSEIDRKGIAEGTAYLGMSKDAVRMALGYPAVHRTPSLEVNTWMYWKDRWRNFVVEFDNRGKVIHIGNRPLTPPPVEKGAGRI